MKRIIIAVLASMCVLGLIGCNKETETTHQLGIVVDGVFYEKASQPMLAEVDESTIIGYIKSYSDTVPTKDAETNISKELIDMPYAKVEGGIVLLYEDEWYLCKAENTEGALLAPSAEPVLEEINEIITYNGKEYNKSELCNDTLKWLKLSEQDRMLSSYFPPEFMIFEEKWGIRLTAENITPTGLTINCTQSAGEPTGELQTGSWYILEQWTQEKGWKEVPYIVEGEFTWTAEAWMIPINEVCEWEVNWEWLYGQIPAGKYRIGKEIMDFRGTGDFDKTVYYVEFNIIK